ncbi:MAG: malate dehydrogenase (quinone), partial [Niabella sp.]|nr:malate dehydrogenase (quinone) [Niabella sp.]
TEVVLIGAGIMSATLGAFINELEPGHSIHIFERLGKVAGESSDAWNNAGTGHSALCELNYTPEKEDGTIDTKKALDIIEQFEVSKQFWSYLVRDQQISDPADFIRTVPHMSFVRGSKDVKYLKKRYTALQKIKLFQGMQYSEDPAVIKKWIPLVVEGRDAKEKVATTYSESGTDVDYGALTKILIDNMIARGNTQLHLLHEVYDLIRQEDGKWKVKVKNMATGEKMIIYSRFVFIGAGGGSLALLQDTDIPESKLYGGFPVGGQWLVCNNPAVVKKHEAKVYGQASVGAPPMSVPHLDTRVMGDQKSILFGPFASFSTKFLKEGSYWDLFESIKYWNIFSMMKVGMKNYDLEKYLVQQLSLSFEDRIEALKVFYPNAKAKDWKLEDAGQRVQIIYKDPEKGATLQFGTEIVSSEDGTIGALLGASPGASTAVSIMLTLLEKCFPDRFQGKWKKKLKTMIPSLGQSLEENEELCNKIRSETTALLRLQ